MTIPPAPIPYLPHLTGTGVLAMGLSSLDPGHWIELDDDVGDFHQHKRAMAARDFSAVYAEAGDTHAAQRELAAMLDSHLLEDHAKHYVRAHESMHCVPGNFLVSDDEGPALWRASLKIADDVALMQSQRGAYHLIAASLCSPSHWSLADKIGRPMREVHQPIPGIHDDLSGRIDRFFEHLRPGRVLRRLNWSLQWGDELFCPAHAPQPTGELFYRAERQSLRRLPESGVIVFTIRVYRCPVRSLAPVDPALAGLRQAVDAMLPPLARYKGLHRYREALAELCAELDTEAQVRQRG